MGRVLGKHHHFVKLKRKCQIKATVTSVPDLPHRHQKRPVTAKIDSHHENTHWDYLTCAEEAAADATTSHCPKSLTFLASELGNTWHMKNHPLTINSTALFKSTLTVTILGKYLSYFCPLR